MFGNVKIFTCNGYFLFRKFDSELFKFSTTIEGKASHLSNRMLNTFQKAVIENTIPEIVSNSF